MDGGMGRWGVWEDGVRRWGMGGVALHAVSYARLQRGGLRGEMSGGVVENKMVGTYVIYEPTNMLSSDVRRVRDSNPRYP